MARWYVVFIDWTFPNGIKGTDTTGTRCYGKKAVARHIDYAFGWMDAHNRIPGNPQIMDVRTGADVTREFAR